MSAVRATPLLCARPRFARAGHSMQPSPTHISVKPVPSVAAGMLTKGGADVTIVDIWPEHVMHMKEKGLTVKCAWANKNLGDESYTVPVRDPLPSPPAANFTSNGRSFSRSFSQNHQSAPVLGRNMEGGKRERIFMCGAAPVRCRSLTSPLPLPAPLILPRLTTPQVKALHLHELQNEEELFDFAFICVKSYDTKWATTCCRNYLKPEGAFVSFQNGTIHLCCLISPMLP